MRSIKSLRSDQRGVMHFVLPFIVLFAVAGAAYLVYAHAATATTYEVSNGNGICINDPGNQGQTGVNLTAKACDQTSRQVFQLVESGGTSSWHTYKVFYSSSAPECIGTAGNKQSAGTKLQAVGCGSAASLYLNNCKQLEIAKSGTASCDGICVDSASGSMILSNCANAGNWNPRQEAVTSSGGGSGGSGGSGSTGTSGSFPGQSGNPVGYAAYGPLGKTAWTGGSFKNGTAANPTVYKDYVFSGGAKISGSYIKFVSCDFVGSTSITGSNLTFTGDRFQSNSVEYYNVDTNGSNLTFSYDSFTPLAKYYTSPPGEVWPSAGAGSNSDVQTADKNAINGNEGYQFALLAGTGPITVDHSDMWGFGNAIVFGNSTEQMTISDNWIHDAADAGPQKYHTDGPGYLNGGAGPSNVTVNHNTIASLGNTNGIAFQAATSGYKNMQITNNFFSGFGYTVAPGFPGNNHFTDSSFTGNVFGTDIEPIWGALYSWTDTGSNVWKCNTYEFRSGTDWTNGNNWHPTSSMNGEYWLPNGGPSTTDYKGNTSCS